MLGTSIYQNECFEGPFYMLTIKVLLQDENNVRNKRKEKKRANDTKST